MAETPAHIKLAAHMHSIGFRLLDQDEEEEGGHIGEPMETLKEAVEHLECGIIHFCWRHPDGRHQWALITAGEAPEETVCDFHVNGAIDAWFKDQP